MVGSGMPETYEMYQVLKYVKKVVGKYGRPVVVPTELADMIATVNTALDDRNCAFRFQIIFGDLQVLKGLVLGEGNTDALTAVGAKVIVVD